MARPSPVVAQFEFAAHVRRRREDLGLPATVVSKHLGFSRNFYSSIENSRGLLATAKLPLLVEVLQFSDDEAVVLSSLLSRARESAWWQPFASLFDESFVQFLGLEAGAVAISSYENVIFSGLIQTAEYSYNVLNSSPNISTVDTARILELRRRRQEEILRADQRPKLRFLVSEAALWQQFGGPSVLLSQLEFVVELIEAGDIEFRVRTFETTPTGLQTSSTLVLLEFDSEVVGPVAYREAAVPVGVTTDRELVQKLQINFEHAYDSSSDKSKSLQLLSARIKSLKGH